MRKFRGTQTFQGYLEHRMFRVQAVATSYFKSVDERAVLDYGHLGAGRGRR